MVGMTICQGDGVYAKVIFACYGFVKIYSVWRELVVGADCGSEKSGGVVNGYMLIR